MSGSAHYLAAGCTAAARLPSGRCGGGVVAGVTLQDDGGRTTQTGELAVFGDAELGRLSGQHRGCHLLLDDRGPKRAHEVVRSPVMRTTSGESAQ